MVHLNANKAGRRKRASTPETCLVLPTVTDGHDGDVVLKSLIDTWLVPRLVEEFVRERALELGLRCVQPSENDADGEKYRAA